MELKEIKRGDEELKEIRRLYEAAFPSDEKMPFHRILSMMDRYHRLYLLKDEDETVGFVYLYQDTVSFLYYLAIEEKLRGRGYGTQILDLLRSLDGVEQIILEIDEVTDDMTEKDETYRRLRFYENAGYVRTGIRYSFFFVDYELMSSSPGYSEKEYRSFAGKIWGVFSSLIRYRT